jgi:hypothetical protein
MKIELDLDDFWPAAATLVGLHFETAEDFARCQAILDADWDLYHSVNADQRYAVVRKRDEHLFADAGLRYRRIELMDMDDLPPQERYERQRQMIQRHFPAFVERLKRQQSD